MTHEVVTKALELNAVWPLSLKEQPSENTVLTFFEERFAEKPNNPTYTEMRREFCGQLGQDLYVLHQDDPVIGSLRKTNLTKETNFQTALQIFGGKLATFIKLELDKETYSERDLCSLMYATFPLMRQHIGAFYESKGSIQNTPIFSFFCTDFMTGENYKPMVDMSHSLYESISNAMQFSLIQSCRE